MSDEFPLLCPLGTSSKIDRDHGDVLRHYDGSFCNHKAPAYSGSSKVEATYHGDEECPGTPHRGHTRMAVTEDPAYGVKEAWQPRGRPGQDAKDLDIGEWVGQALGAASACWSNLEGAGAFNSTACGAINDALVNHIGGIMVAFVKEAEERRRLSDRYLREKYKPKEALLGLATTRSLLEELQVRFQVSTPHPDSEQAMDFMLHELPEDVLKYRTVDPE